MGTRNLTIVKSKKKTKVAQYGQWDGYPTGQGDTIASFISKLIKEDGLKDFVKKVDALKTYTRKEVAEIWKKGGAGEDGLISYDKAKIVDQAHPELCRDHGAGILEMIYNGTVTKVDLNEKFKDDKVWCNYWYLIDLDNQTVSMNGGKAYTFKQWCRKGFMKKLEDKEDEE